MRWKVLMFYLIWLNGSHGGLLLSLQYLPIIRMILILWLFKISWIHCSVRWASSSLNIYIALILNCLDAEATCLQYWILKRQGIEATLPESPDQADLLRVPRLADHQGHWPQPVLQTVSSVLNPLSWIQSGTRGWFTFAICSTAPGQPGGNEAQTEQREYY